MSSTGLLTRSVAHADAPAEGTDPSIAQSAWPDETSSQPRVLPSHRRVHRRINASEFEWLRTARIKYGSEVRVIDVSAGGMAVESEHQLKPHSTIVFELVGTTSGLLVPSRVLRSQVASLKGIVCYRSACSFKRPLELSRLLSDPPRLSAQSPDSIRLDVSLKSLLDQYRELSTSIGAPGAASAVEADEIIIASLDSLLVKASGRRADPFAHHLAELISSVMPMLKQREPADAVLIELEKLLRRAVPPVSVQLTDAPLSPSRSGAESIYFSLTGDDGAPQRVLNVELPPGFKPDDCQFRVLQAAGYLIELLHGGNSLVTNMQTANGAQVLTPAPGQPGPAGAVAPSWQKVVARYRDGRLLRGYTSDFNVTRPQLHLSSNPCHGDSLFVPLPQLKALFFVRDFGGDPTYVEQKTFVGPPQGRKIEITFDDGEVLVGSTLSYRTEGYGFFVHPADKGGNNIRVFVSSVAVRHVRFL